MTQQARFAIVNRLTDVGRETALQVGKLCHRHRAAFPVCPLIPGFGRVLGIATPFERECP